MLSHKKRKVLVIGLDCFDPALLFDQWLDDLPNLKKLVQNGCWGPLRSIIPPITVPAWTAMMAGINAGRLGIYGFRHRKIGTYKDLYFATSDRIKYDRVWDNLSKNGYRVGLIGVPQTYKPTFVNGFMVSSFLAPGIDVEYTYPPELGQRIDKIVDNYMLDVENYRIEDKQKILDEIYDMTDKRTKVTLELMKKEKWNYFMTVYMGPDRLHHAFWASMDKEHIHYKADGPFNGCIPTYYKYIDKDIGKLIKAAGKDTIIFVVSDHGAKRINGAVCINEWLIKEGYLTIKERPTEGRASLKPDNIDWSKTKAWAWGGYYSRIFINVKDREPEGIVPKEDYDKIINELREKFTNIPDKDGKKMDTKIFIPSETFEEVNGDYPDMMVFFDDLYQRAAGTLDPEGTLYLDKNDTGPDDANHNWDGMFIISNWEGSKGKLEGINIIDICPTILNLFGLPVPKYVQGKVIE
ncbi:MAG: alkaline phosphatase family protein [Candidatus Heimdallarchaeota archaeon]